MGFYERWLLPRILDLSMRNKEATRLRALVVPDARGATLEVGIGSGLNLRLYGNRVESLIALDPSEELLRMARKKPSAATFPIEFIARPGEELPLELQQGEAVGVQVLGSGAARPVRAGFRRWDRSGAGCRAAVRVQACDRGFVLQAGAPFVAGLGM